jgi:hypothetical protein
MINKMKSVYELETKGKLMEKARATDEENYA